MKKIILYFGFFVLLCVFSLLIVVFFNPMGSRDALVSEIFNSYLENQFEDYQRPNKEDKVPYEQTNFDHPLIPAEQEKALYDMGVDVTSLPTEITPEMERCFIEKLGQERAVQIANGQTPSAIDFFKAKDCLNK